MLVYHYILYTVGMVVWLSIPLYESSGKFSLELPNTYNFSISITTYMYMHLLIIPVGKYTPLPIYSTLSLYTVHSPYIQYTLPIYSILFLYTVYSPYIQYTLPIYSILSLYTVHSPYIQYTLPIYSTLSLYTIYSQQVCGCMAWCKV